MHIYRPCRTSMHISKMIVENCWRSCAHKASILVLIGPEKTKSKKVEKNDKKNDVRIQKPHTHLHTMTKISAKFQKGIKL